ncbi:GL17303 [Drosophila persimilis]|uniref:GL17303 n=1 Tax=Drosophila persimilis TaxID=7234 RepID=B4GG84_DROPE|nr:GL17303 [Drosophila persimilis]
MSVVNLLILFVSVKPAFTLKDHVPGFRNLRTLIWLSVVSLPLMRVMWVLDVLAASEHSQLLSLLLSGVRVRENLQRTCLRCMGRKVPLLDSSMVVSNSSHNVNGATRPNNFLAGTYDTTTRRNIGISASSTTSRSTAKTSSTTRPSFLRGFESSTTGSESRRGEAPEAANRNERTPTLALRPDGRSLELASSHSSDDDESRTARSSGTHRSTAVSSTPAYLPNITEHVQATTPPELNVVQSPQLFPSVNKPVYAPRWSSQLPDTYIQSPPNIGRWSQDTGSDNEHVHGQKMTISPNPLPNPDLTDTSYLQQHHNKINMPPSILENIRDARDGYEDSLYGRRGEYPDKYGSYKPPSHYGSEKDYPGGGSGSQTIGHMRSFHPDAAYLSDSIYDKQRTLGSGYLGAKSESPYLSKDRITPDIYGSRDGHYSLKRQPAYPTDSLHSVHSLLKNDYHQQQQQQQQQLQAQAQDRLWSWERLNRI